MSHQIACFRCGTSLSSLSLPFSRMDQCPDCSIDLRVCKMCVYYDTRAPDHCLEEDAEDVTEKEHANFCEWFKPSESAFDPQQKSAADTAKDALAALFGDSSDDS
jgi:hypothetical protein